jgi:glycosyltransferase involved in cell wall biosynthesis
VINPLHYGTGLIIKTIEALSYAKPQVTHEFGVRGLGADYPIALVAEEDEAYADAIIEILNKDEKALELSQNAERFMREYQEKNQAAFAGILNTKV